MKRISKRELETLQQAYYLLSSKKKAEQENIEKIEQELSNEQAFFYFLMGRNPSYKLH